MTKQTAPMSSMDASIDAARRDRIQLLANTASSKPQLANARTLGTERTLGVDDLQTITRVGADLNLSHVPTTS
jgi:hypothetical protein